LFSTGTIDAFSFSVVVVFVVDVVDVAFVVDVYVVV
jgi:hypothetical protein